MGDQPAPPPLDDLDARLREARLAHAPAVAPQGTYREMGLAYRVMVELIVGLALGAGVGWGLDSWLGTRPFLLVAMIFLGFAGSMMNIVRAARRFAEQQDAQARRGGAEGKD
ncbi:MAG: AtpZ/AtpI family protein [Pseudomonadota bacterium]